MWNSLRLFRQPLRRAAKTNRLPSVRRWLEVLDDRCLPATLLVTTVTGTGAGSLPNAIAQSAAGDIITFDAALAGQPIVLASALTINKSITIQGQGADKTIVSGAGTDRLFNVTSANPVNITGVTLINGLTTAVSANGGAILNTGNLVLDSDSFSQNLVLGPGSEGAAIASTGAGASVTISNCSFTGGFATGGGGVLFNDTASTASVDKSTMSGNRASANGSGIDNRGTLTISNSSLSQMVAAAGGNLGGAINNQVGSTVTLISCSLTSNAAIQGGGGLNNDGTATIVNTSIIGNNVLMDGGPGGGAIRNTGTLEIFNSTVTGNSDASASATSSGNISNSGGTILLNNTVVAEGTTGNGASPDINGAVLPQSSNNFVGAADAALTGISNGVNANQVGTVANPIFTLLGSLANNGGTTLNRAPLPGSPLINTGNNALIPPGANLDQRNFPRIIGGTVDIGSVEFQPPQTTTDLNVSVSPPLSGPQATLTATVKGPTADSVIPSGTVSFFTGGSIVGGVLVGGTLIGTSTLDAAGVATLSSTTAGMLQFTAVFNGNVALNEFGSTSQQVTAKVVAPKLFAVGSGENGPPQVNVYRQDGALRSSFLAYDASFRGGVTVATADVNGDGVEDVITGAGAGGGPHVKVFDGATLNLLASFFAYDASFRGGVFVAGGDLNNDGKADIVTGAGASGGPHVKAFSGANLSVLQSFFAYGAAFTGGVRVAVGDVDGNMQRDIITGAGPGGGPHVEAFNGANLALLRSFYAFDPAFTGGVFVAAGDINNDGKADIIAGAGQGNPQVKAFSGADLSVLRSFLAYNPAFTGGARVAADDLNDDGVADIITGAGPGGGPHVEAFNGVNLALLDSFYAFDPAFTGGVFVG